MYLSELENGLRSLSRRALLKSAGILLGASALAPLGSPAEAQMSSELLQALRNAGPRDGTVSTAAATPPITQPMVGFMLAHEQFTLPELLQFGVRAEQAGFDLLATSDHLQPWQANERHAGQAWVTMSALGARTRRVWIGPTVTCPTFRYNPAVVAQAFASLNSLYPGRIF